MDRRRFLGVSVAAASLPLGACGGGRSWDGAAHRKRDRSHVAILPAADYAVRFADVILHGLREFRLPVSGGRVVLKPNLVEFDPAGVINTHPAVIAGAVEAFRRLGAREVVVAEGPGHRRDTEHLLTASRVWSVVRDLDVPYVDLNHDDTQAVALRSRFTDLGRLHLPETVLRADLLVSLPKMKTHHWAGVTLSLKNMFGIVPGSIYGWPKNVLHWAGIDGSVVDINSTVPVPQFAIVDGVVGMDGNGPIQGEARPCGVLVMGDDLVAVDATCTRLMSIDPWKVKYLEAASQFLGNAEHDRIVQVGEPLDRFRTDFRVIDAFRHLKALTG